MVIYSVYKIYALNVKVQLQGRRVEKRYTPQIPIIIKIESIYWYQQNLKEGILSGEEGYFITQALIL